MRAAGREGALAVLRRYLFIILILLTGCSEADHVPSLAPASEAVADHRDIGQGRCGEMLRRMFLGD